MSEISKDYKELKEWNKQKKLSNTYNSIDWLKRENVPFVVCNPLIPHLLVADRIDFWPSTGAWRIRKNPRIFRGVEKLIKEYKKGL